MRLVTFSMEFRGTTANLSPGVVLARASAPSGGRLTQIDKAGVHSSFEPVDGHEALLESRLTFVEDGRFEEVGTISFGSGNALRFRSTGSPSVDATPDPDLRQGAVSLKVDAGTGVLAGATGRIVSNFLVAETGELTDRQVGVVFLQEEEKT